MTKMVEDLKIYKNQIDTTKIDINYVALEYYGFIKGCYVE